jgi:hypothetical protein
VTSPHALLLLLGGSQSDQGQQSISILLDLHIGMRSLAPGNVLVAIPDLGCTSVFSTFASFCNFEYLLPLYIVCLTPFQIDLPMII